MLGRRRQRRTAAIIAMMLNDDDQREAEKREGVRGRPATEEKDEVDEEYAYASPLADEEDAYASPLHTPETEEKDEVDAAAVTHSIEAAAEAAPPSPFPSEKTTVTEVTPGVAMAMAAAHPQSDKGSLPHVFSPLLTSRLPKNRSNQEDRKRGRDREAADGDDNG